MSNSGMKKTTAADLLAARRAADAARARKFNAKAALKLGVALDKNHADALHRIRRAYRLATVAAAVRKAIEIAANSLQINSAE